MKKQELEVSFEYIYYYLLIPVSNFRKITFLKPNLRRLRKMEQSTLEFQEINHKETLAQKNFNQLCVQNTERQKKKKNEKEMLRLKSTCQILNIYFTTNNVQELIYGGLYLVYDLMTEESNPMREGDQDILETQYHRNFGLLIIFLKERQIYNKDVSGVMAKAVSINNHYLYKQISDQLQEYQKWIWEDIKIQQSYLNQLKKKNMMLKFEELYKQFETWALEKVKKINGYEEFYSFTIIKFSLNTLEPTTTLTGYSSAFLSLRGADLNNPELIFTKKVYSYMTKETTIGFLLKLLKTTIFQPEMFSTPSIITFDELEIPFQSKDLYFNNRDPKYPFYSDQVTFLPNTSKQEFQLNLRIYKFELKDLEKVIKIREARNPLESALYQNFDSKTQALEYIKKFFKNDHKFIQGFKGIKCGGNCCNGERNDILFENLNEQ